MESLNKMFNQKTFLAIIPARGGSKRLPHKNILALEGEPLITWSIKAAQESDYIDTIVVTSDSNKILNIAKTLGVETLMRPDFLASDTATTFDTVEHAIEHVNNHYDYIVLLQPTSPLRTNQHIDEAIELLRSKDADAIVSVCEVDHSPMWANTLNDTLSMKGFLRKEVLNKRSQDLERYYRLNGAIYICDTKKLLGEKNFLLSDNIFAYKMDRADSIDIDEAIDFKFAEILLQGKTSE